MHIHLFTLILIFNNYQLKFDRFLVSKKTLLNSKDIEIILHRLACQLIENHNDFSNSVLIGLQPRGSYLANRLVDLLKNEYQIKNDSLLIQYYKIK